MATRIRKVGWRCYQAPDAGWRGLVRWDKRERIGAKIGELSAAQMTKVSDALRLWLELG
jgi:hypothetical protein